MSASGSPHPDDTAPAADHQANDEHDFEAEVSDLRRAHSATPRPLNLSIGLSRRQRLWRLSGSVVALLAVGVMLFSVFQIGPFGQPSVRSARQAAQALDASSIGTTCYTDATWSPDSTRIALVGYQGSCVASDYVPSIAAIFDPSTGHANTWFLPDGDILRALAGSTLGALPPPQPNVSARAATQANQASEAKAPIIYYQHIIWSPDGQRLALIFSVYALSQNTPSVLLRYDGVIIVQTNGALSQILLRPQQLVAPLSTEWDLVHGRALEVPPIPPYSSSPAFVWDATHPPALGYHWTGGTFAADTPLKSDAAPASSSGGIIGNPDGGARLSIWQPGVVDVPFRWSNFLVWNTSFTAWSPDGHYLIDALGLAARLGADPLSPAEQRGLAALQLDAIPLLGMRDPALQQLTRAIPRDSSDPNARQVAVAWRPDGRMLAAYSLAPTGPMGISVALYDTASGQKIASLLPLANIGNSLSTTTILRWSPNGSHLLLVSAPLGTISLWGPDDLP
jgi:WD40 repeat protein